MTSIIKYILIFTFLLPVTNVHSQNQYRKNYRIDDSRVSCNIKASVVPESLLIRGEMEITYKNESDDTLSTINFTFPLSIADRSIDENSLIDNTGKPEEINAPYYCIIDSILYRGVPLDPDNNRLEKRTLKLPQPLLPGEKGFFFLTFNSKISPKQIYGDVIHYNMFFPMINIYHEKGWLSVINSFYYDNLHEYSDYNVVLKVCFKGRFSIYACHDGSDFKRKRDLWVFTESG